MKRKFTFLMTAFLLVFSYAGLAQNQVESGTTYSTPSVSGLPEGWSGADGGGTTYIKLIAADHYIQTAEFEQNGFSSITIQARKFGGPNATQAKITVSWYDSEEEETVLGTIDPTSTSLTNYTISNPATTESGAGYVKIQCKDASSSKGSGVSEVTINYTAPGVTPVETVATPTFSPEAGTYTSTQTVSISCETTGATIYYTTDGSEPTTSSSVYGTALAISETTTVKAMAVKENMNNSEVATAEYIITTAYSGDDYVRVTDITALTDGARVIIAARYNTTATSYYAMTAAATGKPTGVLFSSTTSNNGEILPASILNSESTYYWTVNVTSDGYTFTNASDKVLGYTSGTNFATGGNNTEWIISRETSGTSAMVSEYEGFYITNKNNSGRGIALNNSYNYGPYATSNTNSSDYNFYLDFFVQGYVPAAIATPTFTPQAGTYYETKSVTISCDTPNSTIYYTTNGEDPTDASTEYTEAITISETTTIKAIAYVGANYGNIATATYTIAQPISTIPALFAAATPTETVVFVTFNNWVVSGVSTNGKNVFVTDNNGNGFVIYYGSDMSSTYAAGDILSGSAVSCSLKKYNGFAELLNVAAADLTITAGGTVATANIAMADLTGVNTGALVQYDNLTCSIENSKYYLSDGTTTIQVFNSLYAFDALEAGNTYNITGVYQQYNNTKEILPRSAADIEEVETPIQEFTLTVANPDHITFTVVYGTDGVLTNGESDNIEPGTEITLTVNVADDYLLDAITVIGANGQSVEVTETSTTGVYAFNMPAFNATLNATTIVAPASHTYTLASSIESGKSYIIVGQANGNYYAMGNDKGNNRNAYEITLDGTTATATIATGNNVHEFTISSLGEGFYSICDAIEPGYLYAASSSSNYLKTEATLDENHNGDWTITINAEGVASVVASNSSYTRNVMQFNNGNILFACYGSASQHPVYLYQKDETPAPETYTLYIPGYNNATNSDGGYYLIAFPVTVNPADVEGYPEGMIEGNFDLYSFDQEQEKEWRNYGTQAFNLVPGKGYLYAHDIDVELALTGVPYSGNGEFPLSYTESAGLAGWNLMGNPYNENVSVDKDFYIMNEDGTEIISADDNMPILPMQGFFVVATEENQKVTFSEYTAPIVPLDRIVMNVSLNRGNVIDRAIVRFGEGEQLPKFQLNPNNTKLYIPQGNNDFAIVRSANQGEMPVNFKARENGTYTLAVETENVEMDYLHLIDNKTGMDVDLLQTPSYTFEATTRDYASRFRLVFSANDNNAEGNANFAYFNGSEWQISNVGEATLQVVDVMGRIVKSMDFEGNATVSINEMPGVYMMRLINGNDVKVQKVIIK